LLLFPGADTILIWRLLVAMLKSASSISPSSKLASERHFQDLRICALGTLSVKMAVLNNIPPRRHEARPTQPIKRLRMERKTLYLLLAFGLASCASMPENLFVPVSQTASGVSAVDMLVATTRRSAENPGELYFGERGNALTFQYRRFDPAR
jgi:hypothetical protein